MFDLNYHFSVKQIPLWRKIQGTRDETATGELLFVTDF